MSSGDLDVRVLASIAQGSNTFYAITKKRRVGSNDGVLASLGRLLGRSLIEKGPKGSRGTQPYLLTEDGFDAIIRYIDYVEDFEAFAKLSRGHFPLVFGYWDSLRRNRLTDWVRETLGGEVRRIDAAVFSQLYSGDRVRYSHEEFVNDLYGRVYGPWNLRGDSMEFSDVVPVERLRAFLVENPVVLGSRRMECSKLDNLVEVIMKGNKWYRMSILS